MSAPALLFVYGTLKRGGGLHHELVRVKARFLRLAKIRGELFHLKGVSYPGAFLSESPSYIQGELFKLANPAETLKRLDRVEGCKEGLFSRKLVEVWAGNRKMKAWTYLCQHEERKSQDIRKGIYSARSKADC